MADPYAPFGYAPPTLAGPMRQRPLTPFPIPPLQPMPEPTTPDALMPQTEAERADLEQSRQAYAMLMEAAGIAPLYRSGQHAAAGRPLEAVANAGRVMLPFRPMAGVMTMGGALGGGLASDLGLFGGPSPATAQNPAAPVDPQARIRQLDADIAKATKDLQALSKRIRDPDRLYVESRPLELRLQQLGTERTQLQTLIGTAAQTQQTEEARRRQQQDEEEGRALVRAEEARTRERSRYRSFDTTRVGQIWNEFGGFAPMILGGATGAILRSARYPHPIRESTIGGALSYNIPLGYDAYGTPFENPERRGQEAFARELPLGNPLRTQTEEYAQTLPVSNPLRDAAAAQFWDPMHAAKRLAFGASEGYVGGHIGAGLTAALGRVYNALFGRGRAGPTPPGTPPSPPAAAPAAPQPPAPPPPAVATLGGQQQRPLAPEPAPPAPRGVAQQGGPPAGAVWNERTQRWHLGNQIIGGRNRWPPP